jgi:NAD(P)H-dependent FMN reductase
MPLKLLGVAGSMREGSYSLRALTVVLRAAADRGADTSLLDLRLANLPMYNPQVPRTDEHGHVRRATEAVGWADAFVLASPDYHGSMSGAMKNFLDYHWEEFTGKLFGYVCASHEKGLTVMDQMRTAVRQCYGWSLPYGVSVHGENDFHPDGSVGNVRVEKRLRMLARDVVTYGTLLHEQFVKDLHDTDQETFVARYRK